MTATDERTLVRIHANALRAGDRIEQILQGEFGSNSYYFTVKRMVERRSGYYLVTDRDAERPLYWDSETWRESLSGPEVEIDDTTTSNRWLGL